MEYALDPSEAYILVVEDNAQNLLLICRLLDHIGVREYRRTSSGREMFNEIEMMPRVDLILLDLHLPYEDGFSLLPRIQAHPQLEQTRVVAVTADVHPETVGKSREVGFDGFLGKPISPRDFPRQLRQILAGEAVWSINRK